MKYDVLLEKILERELSRVSENGPPHLREAMFHAVFPAGGRVRPKLALAISRSLSGDVGDVAFGAAAAVEFIHSASLVHDDMPCFDDAPIRRGKPSVHRLFGESVALLAGDGLIAAAFEVLARNGAGHPRLSYMVTELARATGASDGLVSGQAWEDDPLIPVGEVHRRKTGALFEASAAMAAMAADSDHAPWRAVGLALGSAYQIADDILDILGDVSTAGKPLQQDLNRNVANEVKDSGLREAISKLDAFIQSATMSIPECRGRSELSSLINNIARRLVPPGIEALGIHPSFLETAKESGARPDPLSEVG